MQILPGHSYPLGATVYPDGVNFCLFSRNATAIELLLFDTIDDTRPTFVIPLDPRINRTFYYWHIFVKHLQPGQLYGFRVSGPFRPNEGLRFDGDKLLLDPYGLEVMYGDRYEREAAMAPGDNCAYAMKNVIVDPNDYEWDGDEPLRSNECPVIYEMHVDAFTRHPNAGLAPEKAGTYAGLIERIPYLQSLGVTAVELLPVQQFDPYDAPLGRINYWGYSPIAFFAPHRGYSSRRDPLGPINEFRDMVKALHRAGIEVILDVVFNHTAEGDHRGPTFSFRGLENNAYYLLEPHDRARYMNYSGCGNTLKGNHSIVRRLITDCLRHWVQMMHVDGFRFDLASVLARDGQGHVLADPPILWEIESDPVLAGTRIIAEAWDAGGLYQVGSFIGHRWAEWNGRYRDDVRRFVKSDPAMVGALAAGMTGSRDMYPRAERSINFITAHDGFTLNDLVSYNDKHNEANGEDNRDGSNDNHSWNCGVEGLTEDPAIEMLRVRQIKNFLSILLLSLGTPMLLMGDEVRRTQRGNNNAYCQDNALSWFDWTDMQRHADILRFTRGLIRFRRNSTVYREPIFWNEPGGPRVTWHGVTLRNPDWSPDSRSLAVELCSAEGECVQIMLNAYWEALDFDLPSLPPGRNWQRVVDTSLPPPDDCPTVCTVVGKNGRYRVGPRSVVVLVANVRNS